MTIGAAQQFFLGASKATGGGAAGYQIERSLRFSSNDSAFCARTPAVAGNRRTFTWAGWLKRSSLATADHYIFGAYGTKFEVLRFEPSTDKLQFLLNGGSAANLATTQVFRDFSAWYHIVVACDTTIASPSSDRIKIYVNGAQITSFSTATYPAQNYDSDYNNTVDHQLGALLTSGFYNGYMADIHFIDGQALTPSSFTEVSATTGQLIPKQYTGSFGTNGFWLKFSDNSAATATTLGKDYSGNSNNWTLNNISVGFPVTQNYSTTTTGTAPTPYQSTNYYALAFDGDTSTSFSWTTGTWAMDWTSLPSAVTVSSSLRIFCYPRLGTLTVNINGSNVASITGNSVDWRVISFTGTISTISFTGTDTYAGVYAIEVNGAILIDPRANKANDSLVDTPTSYGTGNSGGDVRGNFCTLNPLKMGSFTLSNGNLDCVSTSSYGLVLGTIGMSSGKWYLETTLNGSGAANSIGIATDAVTITQYPGYDSLSWVYLADGRKINGGSRTSYGASFTTGDVIGVAFDADAGSLTFYKNGSSQGTAFTGLTSGPYFPVVGDDSSGSQAEQSLNFGQRAFAYTAPSGFKALCDTNLPAPVVAKSSDYFQTVLWTGSNTATARTISGLQFSPDLVWAKSRSLAYSHNFYDTVRGTGKGLYSDSTGAESTNNIYGYISAFNSDGFTGTPGSTDNGFFNQTNATYAAWCWDAGSSTVTNTQGSITSQVRTNGYLSIVTYTGNGTTGATIGHSLGVAPSLILVKCRSNAAGWLVYHSSIGATKYLALESTAAAGTYSGAWNDTAPTSTVFSVGNDSSVNTSTRTYVAYCFSPLVGYSAMGSYVGNGSATDGPFVYTGFRPKWILLKDASAGGTNWTLLDTSRDTYNVATNNLYPNLSNAENSGSNNVDILSNGFKLKTATGGGVNTNGNTVIYAAFAESPLQYSRAR